MKFVGLLFLQNLLLVVAEFKLLIIHNNDMHANFEEINNDGKPCTEKDIQLNSCFGGFARVKQAAIDAKKEAAALNIPSIFLNAGDSFQGTAYFTLKKWEIVAPLVNALEFDAMCLGNHEFDTGISGLVNYLNHVHTPVVCSNLNISTEKQLDLPNLKPSTILTVQGKRIGVIGYLTPTTMTGSNTGNLQILDEIPSIREEALRLKNEGVNIIIALGHSGFLKDLIIADQVEDISLVVGGHSHSLLYNPKDSPPSVEKVTSEYPHIVVRKSGKKIPVVQSYKHTKYVGKLLVTFDDEGNVINASGNNYLLNSLDNPKDPKVEELVASWVKPLKNQLNEVQGYTAVPLISPNPGINEFESTSMNLMTDAILYNSIKNTSQMNNDAWTRATVSIFNSGGVRRNLEKGFITLGDLLTYSPFGNELLEVQIPGSVLKSIINGNEYHIGETKLPVIYFSGMRVVFDRSKTIENNIASIEILCANCSIPRYEPLSEEKLYTVIVSNYLLHAFKFLNSSTISFRSLNMTDTEALINYIKQQKIVYPIIDGRLKFIDHTFDLDNYSISSLYLLIIVIFSVLVLISCVILNTKTCSRKFEDYSNINFGFLYPSSWSKKRCDNSAEFARLLEAIGGDD